MTTRAKLKPTGGAVTLRVLIAPELDFLLLLRLGLSLAFVKRCALPPLLFGNWCFDRLDLFQWFSRPFREYHSIATPRLGTPYHIVHVVQRVLK